MKKPTIAADAYMDKEMKARLWAFNKDPILAPIGQFFGWDVYDRSSVLHTGFIEHLRLNREKYKDMHAFEVGTWNGLTSLYMASIFKTVTTIDIADMPIKYDVWEQGGCMDRIVFHKIEHEDDKYRFLHQAYDFAYLDGDHTKPEMDFMLGKNAKHGFLVHEAWADQPANYQAIKDLRGKFFGHNFAFISASKS